MTAAKRILIVDDSNFIRTLVKVSLERMAGWEVVTASSGDEALVQAVAAAPDAILLDVVMPEMDGPTAMRKLRANRATKHIPVIFLTARDQPDDHRELVDLGADGLIAKPFDPMDLASQVGGVLGWGR
jgi:CheY-like chemotaxis protein